MKNLSLRLKITLWFSAVLVAIIALTYVVILSVSHSVRQKTIQDDLIQMVEKNMDEVELSDKIKEDDEDLFIPYGDKYLEIDDDFETKINGISAALYQKDGTLLCGETPEAGDPSSLAFSEAELQKKTISGTTWYVYDRVPTKKKLGDLVIRGTVSGNQGNAQFSSIVQISLILMPFLFLLAVLGGYAIAGRSLRPVETITQTAAQIGQGRDLKKRIALGEGKDELHQLATAFDDMFDRLDTSFEAEKQFTSDASHELRTPMSVIMAQCEYSLEKDRTPEEYRDALRVVQRQGGKMSHLIADMLSITRLDRKADDYALKKLDFSQLVQTVCDDLQYLQDKNIRLESEIQPHIYIEGNEKLLTRLLTNLITNAYRYGRENGHTRVSLKADHAQALLAVADDGIGIEKGEQEKIFRRFYQSDRARSGEGTGLGLAMVQEIAALHDGTITVESTPGQGSTFVFSVKNV